MKLAESIQQLLKKKPEKFQVFLSLVLDATAVVAEAWHLTGEAAAVSLGSVIRNFPQDSWEERLRCADSAIVNLEEKAGTVDIRQVVLGLPATYLTAEGEILGDIRRQIRKLTQELALKPLGFVSLPQALIHYFKKEEGVPPSTILLGASADKIVVSLYKVGVLAAQKIVSGGDRIAAAFEEALKSFTSVEVLPSRIQLYGTVPQQLEELRVELLRHPWPTRANFLHFPKIEILSPEMLVAAVSLAGASELAVSIGEEAEVVTPPITAPPPQEELGSIEAESNMETVSPEELGFSREVDVLETEAVPPESEHQPSPVKKQSKFRLVLSVLGQFKLSLPDLSGLKGGGPLWVGLLGVIIFGGLIYWILPHATVTILEIPKTLTESAGIVVDPAGGDVDTTNKIIPGKKQEKTISGAKTMPTTGKKKVGDPAKGTVTIYNKITSARTFKKGTILSSNSLQFALDGDVAVASASESIGSITFGKATTAISAVNIGPEGNFPAGTEFSFKDYATNVAVARNDQPLTGGTSREVTVVSRADYDNLVKTLSGELVEKAKQDLAGSVSGNEKLIDATIKTVVMEKIFNQEIDQEASVVEGKVTLTVSGVSYNEDQLRTLLKTLLSGSIPAGYSLVDSRTTVSVSSPVVRKDGKISLSIKFQGLALPILDTVAIKKELAGKKLSSAQNYLKNLSGVGGVEFNFRYWPWRSRLPINQNNISVSVAIQE